MRECYIFEKQMKRIFLFLVCCFVPLALVAQNTRSAQGIVFDQNGVPMAEAKLTAVGFNSSALTGADGTFNITVSPYAKFIEVSKEGYLPVQVEIDGSYLIVRLRVDKKYAENKAKAEEEARKAAEAEKARLAEEAEAARLAVEAAEQARLEAEERKRIEEERRIAAEKAAAEKAERDRLAAEAKAKAEEEKRIAAEKAAAEKAEAAKRAAEEKARIAEEKRIAAEKAAAEKAEKARLAAEAKAKAEEEKRLAAERAAAERAAAEQARLATQQQQQQAQGVANAQAEAARLEKLAQEQAKREAELAKKQAEQARIAEEKRIAAEKAAAEKQKRVEAHKAYVEEWKSAEFKGYRSQVEATFGLDFDLMCTSNIHYIGGYQINNILYVGVGTGVSLYLNDVPTPKWSANSYSDMANLPLNLWSVPVFGYFRANFANRRLIPFFALSAGYRFGTKHCFDMPWDSYAEYSTSGIFVNPQIGLNFRMTKKSDIYITAGFNLMQMPRFDNVSSTMFVAEFYKEFYGGFDLRLGFTF